MRFTRLVIEADRRTVSLALHPRLTVVAGVDERVRAGLSDELIGGLAGSRSGVHLEVADDAGRQLAIFRPAQGAHRIIDATDGVDVSDEFRAVDGRLDVFGAFDIDARRAPNLLHLGRTTLIADTHRHEIINRLAEVDQTALWSAASRVRITDDELQALRVGIDTTAEDAELVARIERRHQSLEAAHEQHLRLRQRAAAVCCTSLIAALPVGLVNPTMAVPILAIGLLTVLLTFVYRARIEKAERSEQSALADAGANSYLGFIVQRVNGMFDDSEARRKLVAVAEDHRNAAVQWTRLAGDVSVEWALQHHLEIDAAARLRRQLRSLGSGDTAEDGVTDAIADLAQAVVSHLTRLKAIGRGGESFPLILDDPFTEFDPTTKLAMLDLLAQHAGTPQVVLLTDQDDVAAWARSASVSGGVSIVEPHTEAARTRHLAG